MTTNDILNTDLSDIMRLSRKELLKAMQTLKSTAQKRLGYFSPSEQAVNPAIVEFREAGGVKSFRNMSLNNLRAEYKKYVNFLTDSTSTRKGFNSWYRRTKKKIGDNFSADDVSNFGNRVLRVFLKLRSEFAFAFSKQGSEEYNACEYEVAQHPDETDEQIADRVAKRLWGITREYTVDETAYENEDFRILDDYEDIEI